MVPVRLVDVDDKTADRMAIADNRIGELSGWEEGGLADIMREFRADAGDDSEWFHGLGFAEDEAAALLGDWEDPFAESGSTSEEIVDAGKATITVTVSDGSLITTETFDVTVTSDDDAPTGDDDAKKKRAHLKVVK